MKIKTPSEWAEMIKMFKDGEGLPLPPQGVIKCKRDPSKVKRKPKGTTEYKKDYP